MKRRMSPTALLIGSVMGFLFISTKLNAATSNPVNIETTENCSVVLVGLTLGQNWATFPTRLATDYDDAGSYYRLDGSWTLYVTWIMDSTVDSVPQAVNPPQPLANFDWFDNDELAYLGPYSNEPPLDSGGYTACPAGQGLEAPLDAMSTPVSSTGILHVEDIHGGIGTTTTLEFYQPAKAPNYEKCWFLIAGWTKPGTYYDDYLGQSVNLKPEGTWRRKLEGGDYPDGLMDVKVVEWVSCDINPTSLRQVDAQDVSHFASLYDPQPTLVRYGFESGENPNNSPNFQANFSPFGGDPEYIESSDISALGSALGDSCGLTGKTADGEDPQEIMAWFGFAPTGREIVIDPSGRKVPEYDLVDPVQRDRGIADPYGYRKNAEGSTAVRPLPWGGVKQLYR